MNKPITYKDNVSELVSISVKEAMQMLMDNNCKPVKVCFASGKTCNLCGVLTSTASFVITGMFGSIDSIYRRQEYVLGYNGEKLPPLPEGYGLMPEVNEKFFSGILFTTGRSSWTEDCNWVINQRQDILFAVPIDSYKWRALFPPKAKLQPVILEAGKWYECEDGSVVRVLGDAGLGGYHICSDHAIRLKDGTALIPIEKIDCSIIRQIEPELSISLSNLDHETANKVWKAKKNA